MLVEAAVLLDMTGMEDAVKSCLVLGRSLISKVEVTAAESS